MPNQESIDAAHGRVFNKIYLSRSFLYGNEYSEDFGKTAKFIHQIFPTSDDPAEIMIGELHTVKPRTPRGKIQVEMLIAREKGNIKRIFFQKVSYSKNGKKELKEIFQLSDKVEIDNFLNLFHSIHSVDPNNTVASKIEIENINEYLKNKDIWNKIDSELIEDVIKNNVESKDIIAISSRKRVIQEFEKMLEDKNFFEAQRNQLGAHSQGEESVWQKFFEQNPWLLGISLSEQFLTSWDENKLEQATTGFSLDSRGKRIDALLKTTGVVSNLVFAEIKTSNTKLLDTEYRPECWSPSRELVGGVAQIQTTIQKAIHSLQEKIIPKNADGSDNYDEIAYLIQPQSYLIIGKLSELHGSSNTGITEKIRSFEMYRKNIFQPTILTFDEVLEKAKWSVNQYDI